MNTTQIPNAILDSISDFTGPELKLVMLLFHADAHEYYPNKAEILDKTGLTETEFFEAVSGLLEGGLLALRLNYSQE